MQNLAGNFEKTKHSLLLLTFVDAYAKLLHLKPPVFSIVKILAGTSSINMRQDS